MGMAASQARFLGLTARKNNVEYEGQQINQQRTALANQSANYYNDLLGMSVPVPPAVDSYTKTVYTFSDGALTNTITAMMREPGGACTVSYLKQWVDDFAPVSAASSIVTGSKTGPWSIGANELRALGTAPASSGKDAYYDSLTTEQQKALIEEEKEYIGLLQQKYGTADWVVRYVEDTSTGKQQPYFYKKTDLTSADYDSTRGTSLSHISCYTIGSATKTEERKAVKDCTTEQDSSGRYINITIPEHDDAGKVIPGSGVTYALTTNTITDQGAYEDAMNNYEYEKYQYDQTIQEINAKIEIIQSQDKNLELRLKQLDTEQDAISTEMDAVTKVIEKNVESSFKTFG